MRSARCALLVLALWAVALSAFADAPESKGSKEQARVHFKQGVVLVREGAYRAALVELKRAYELSPDYRVLFNIGQTELQLGEYAAAIEAFEAYLAQGGERIDAARRSEVEANLLELRKRVATLRIEAPAGVQVSIDGVRVGVTPIETPLRVSVGRHELTGSTEDGRSAREVIEVAGGDQRVVRLALDAKGQAEARSKAAPADAPPGLSTRRRTGIVLAAAGGALGASAIVTGTLARGARDDHRAALGRQNGDASEIKGTRDDLKRLSLTTDLLLGGAAALAITGVVLALIPDRKEPPVYVAVGPSGFTLKGRF